MCFCTTGDIIWIDESFRDFFGVELAFGENCIFALSAMFACACGSIANNVTICFQVEDWDLTYNKLYMWVYSN